MRMMHLFKKVLDTSLLTEREKIHAWMVLADMTFESMPRGQLIFDKIMVIYQAEIIAIETDALHESVKQHLKKLQIVEIPRSIDQLKDIGMEVGIMLCKMLELEYRHQDDPEEVDDDHINDIIRAFFLDEKLDEGGKK